MSVKTLLDEAATIPSYRVDIYESALNQINGGKANDRHDLSEFLVYLFADLTTRGHNPFSGSKKRNKLVADFLKGRTKYAIDDVLTLLHHNSHSSPPKRKDSIKRSKEQAEEGDPGHGMYAAVRLDQWSIRRVTKLVWKEGHFLSSKKGGLHGGKPENTWNFIENLELGPLMDNVQEKAPLILRLLSASAASVDSIDEFEHLDPPLPRIEDVNDSLRGDLLQCWRLVLGTDNLKKYFEDPTRRAITPDELFQHAKTLVKRYLSAEARDVAVKGGPRAEEWFQSCAAWTGKSDVPRPPEESTGDKKQKQKKQETSEKTGPFAGDLSLANRVQRMRDCMIHYTFQAAVAERDIGRVMDVLNIWVFTFAGGGKTKYTNELLELACNFEFEYTPQLKAVILDNWLVNITGWPGHWFPGDLLVEKQINQLKKMAQRSDQTFGSFFFRRIVALNVRHLIDGTARLRTALGLSPRTQAHRRKQQDAAMNQLQRRFEEHKTHLFCPGRAYGFYAADNLAGGFNKLYADKEKRIRDFVDRTCREFGKPTAHSSQPSPPEEESEDEEEEIGRFRDVRPNRMVNSVVQLGDEY